MSHSEEIFKNWNKLVAQTLLKNQQDQYLKNIEYYTNRILSQSWNIFSSRDRAFILANDMLNCFLGIKDRTKDEIVNLLKQYYFNPKLVSVLEEIKDLEFLQEFNSSPSIWMNSTIKMYAAYSLFYFAFRDLVDSIESGKESEIYTVLSSEKEYNRFKRYNSI